MSFNKTKKNYGTIFLLDLPNFYKINLLNEIVKKIDIYVIFLSQNSIARNNDFYLIDRIKFNYIIIDKNHAIEQKNFRNKITTLYFIYRQLQNISYNNIVVNEWALIEHWFVLLLSLKKKKIFILESSIYESKINGVKAFIKKKFLNFIDIALPSGKAHKELLDILGFRDKTYLTNGVGILNTPDIQKSNYLNSPRKFLFAGRLVNVKNIKFLVEIFNGLPNFILNIIGNGEQEEYLKSIAKPNINFLGNINNKDIGSIFIENDAFILPSYKEPWGLVIEEALYFGLPILSSNKVGASDYYIKAKKTGEVFNPLDKKGFLKAFNKLVRNYAFYVKNVKKIDFNTEINKQVEVYINILND